MRAVDRWRCGAANPERRGSDGALGRGVVEAGVFDAHVGRQEARRAHYPVVVVPQVRLWLHDVVRVVARGLVGRARVVVVAKGQLGVQLRAGCVVNVHRARASVVDHGDELGGGVHLGQVRVKVGIVAPAPVRLAHVGAARLGRFAHPGANDPPRRGRRRRRGRRCVELHGGGGLHGLRRVDERGAHRAGADGAVGVDRSPEHLDIHFHVPGGRRAGRERRRHRRRRGRVEWLKLHAKVAERAERVARRRLERCGRARDGHLERGDPRGRHRLLAQDHAVLGALLRRAGARGVVAVAGAVVHGLGRRRRRRRRRRRGKREQERVRGVVVA